MRFLGNRGWDGGIRVESMWRGNVTLCPDGVGNFGYHIDCAVEIGVDVHLPHSQGEVEADEGVCLCWMSRYDEGE